MQAAVASLDGHVTPRDCFIWYSGNRNGWARIIGTGCAHYVAHQLNIGVGGPRCLAGFSHRVADVVGEKYVLFLKRSNQTIYETAMCMGNRPEAKSRGLLKFLRATKPQG
jgi:hypothetical protein